MNIQQLSDDKLALERVIASELKGFTDKYPGLRVCVLHEWTEFRKVGELPAKQVGHSIRVEVSL